MALGQQIVLVWEILPVIPILPQQENQSVGTPILEQSSGFQLTLSQQWGWEKTELSAEHMHRKWRPQLFTLISLRTDSVLQDKSSLMESANSLLELFGSASLVDSHSGITQPCSSLLRAVKKIAPWDSTAIWCHQGTARKSDQGTAGKYHTIMLPLPGL